MTNRYDTDVFVVGGGPAGLAMAIAARGQGLRVIVADAAGAPADKCCGEGLMPDGAAALREFGLAIPSEAARFRGIAFFDGERSASGDFTNNCGFGVRRTLLHRLLFERALQAGAECRFETRVTGIGSDRVSLDRGAVRTRWIVGADGRHSRVRAWAGLDAGLRATRRYGFRRHFEIDQAPERVELHWGGDFQAFVTPVHAHEVGVAILSRKPSFRVSDALARLPELKRRLGSPVSVERGATTGAMTLRSQYAGNVALVGDASGTVDAITGDGLSLAFRQAIHLSEAMAKEDLSTYPQAHRKLAGPPKAMAGVLLALADRPLLRRGAIQLLAAYPVMFHALLSAHAGAGTPFTAFARNGTL